MTDQDKLRAKLLERYTQKNYWEIWTYPIYYETLPTKPSRILAIIEGSYEKAVEYALGKQDFCGYNSMPGNSENVFLYGCIEPCKIPIVKL